MFIFSGWNSDVQFNALSDFLLWWVNFWANYNWLKSSRGLLGSFINANPFVSSISGSWFQNIMRSIILVSNARNATLTESTGFVAQGCCPCYVHFRISLAKDARTPEQIIICSQWPSRSDPTAPSGATTLWRLKTAIFENPDKDSNEECLQ